MGPLPTDDAAEYWKASAEAGNEYAENMRAAIARLTAEITTLRARLETVEAETRERCAKVADKVAAFDLANDDKHGGFTIDKITAAFIASSLRNLEPRHD